MAMNQRNAWIRLLESMIIFSLLGVILYCGALFYSNVKPVVDTRTQARYIDTTREFTDDIAMIRNALSRQLNEMSKKIGKLQCEKSNSKVNERGGWCKHASKEDGGHHNTDKILLVHLSEFLKGKRVASFGDGPGAYKRELTKLGQVRSYDAYDGSPYCEETSRGLVKFLDLSIPQYGLPFYDWIVSLEVAEHIPSQFESVYLDNVFRHAREGIILSWAVPGQNGLSHVNNKPLDYVIDVMKANGFLRDEILSTKLQKLANLWAFRTHLYVYVRNSYPKQHNESILTKWYT